MRGSKIQDIKKVIRVIKQQLVGTVESALKGVTPPLTTKEFEERMNRETYGKVKDAWTEEANQMRQNSQIMKDLRKTLEPEVIERIKAQRLAQMESGQRFDKY